MVSRKDTARLISYHFIDSLLVLNYLPENSTVCDLGSGAGLPGIPIKIMRDDITLYLIESIRKKAAFLSLVAEELNLEKIKILPERAENITDVKCDVVVIRLLGKIKKLVPVALPLLNKSGKIIFYKAQTAADEILEAKNVLAKFQFPPTFHEIALPGTNIVRRLVIIKKIN